MVRRSRGERDESKDQALDQATFQKLRYRITDASGIFVPDDENSRFILERRLLARLRLRGLSSFEVYESTLDDPEMEEILDAVAVHETYFFREQQQLKVFSEQILPELIGVRRPLKIWSAGCSTGEEAYTIGMLLAEQGLLDHGPGVADRERFEPQGRRIGRSRHLRPVELSHDRSRFQEEVFRPRIARRMARSR